MAGETQTTFIGNLTADPELRFTQVSRGFAISEAMYGWNSRVQVVC